MGVVAVARGVEIGLRLWMCRNLILYA